MLLFYLCFIFIIFVIVPSFCFQLRDDYFFFSLRSSTLANLLFFFFYLIYKGKKDTNHT